MKQTRDTAPVDLPGHVWQKGDLKQLKLPLIATRRHKYDLGDGEVWERKKGELLRPDAFTKQDIQRLRCSKQPGFETLISRTRAGTTACASRRNIPDIPIGGGKAKYFPTFPSAEVPTHELPVVLSVDPEQKGGPL